MCICVFNGQIHIKTIIQNIVIKEIAFKNVLIN